MSPRWHDGPLAGLASGDGPVAWSVAGADAVRRPRLARALVARRADVRADTVRLSRSPHGAPIVDAPAGWHLSLSGRDDACLIGVARQPIGVDREPLDDAPPLWDMLAPSEIAALHALPVAERPLAWLRCWTIKEAHAKLIGEPLRIAPETIETRIDGPEDATAVFEGVSRCRTRRTAGAIETVAMWA